MPTDSLPDFFSIPLQDTVTTVVSTTSLLEHHLMEMLAGSDILIVLALVPLVVGINLIFWGSIGVVRALSIIFFGQKMKGGRGNTSSASVRADEIAIIIPAHNEELVIADTIGALRPIADLKDIYVISDGSSDTTVALARTFGVNVLDLQPSYGKAGALEEGIRHFELVRRYKAVLLVDADTRLDREYVTNALPYLHDPQVIAVAGYAKTIWNPSILSWSQKLFLLHRDRIYLLSQKLIKFGQTWEHTNVTHIVPGFASIYRTSILDKITINPKGLVIEDFNMTFEVHHKNLGVIAHSPEVVAYTQDPDNWSDYCRQIRRWHLGLWQTIRKHGFWPSRFWAALAITLMESVLGSAVFLILPGLLVAGMMYGLVAYGFLQPDWVRWLTSGFPNIGFLLGMIVVIWFFDYVLSVVAAIAQRRPEYLLYGILFPVLRVLDAIAFLEAIPKAYLTTSNGRWISPTRRTNAAP